MLNLAKDKQITTVIQNTTACHDSEKQRHAMIQNSCDSEYNSTLLSEHNGVPQQILFITFMLQDSRPSLLCCCKFSLLEECVMSTVKQFPMLCRTAVPSPSWSSSFLGLLNILAPELFFFNFSTHCIYNVSNTGTKYVIIMKQTAF